MFKKIFPIRKSLPTLNTLFCKYSSVKFEMASIKYPTVRRDPTVIEKYHDIEVFSEYDS
jgi:hypothetical protein